MAAEKKKTEIEFSSKIEPKRSILLYSWILDSTGSDICERILRGELTDEGMRATFSRGLKDESCDGVKIKEISWEVVQFPEGTLVQQLTHEMNANSYNVLITLPITVDSSRTLVFAGGQWASGQVHGEGKNAVNSQAIGEMRARAILAENGQSVRLIRESAKDSAKFTFFVVQLKP